MRDETSEVDVRRDASTVEAITAALVEREAGKVVAAADVAAFDDELVDVDEVGGAEEPP